MFYKYARNGFECIPQEPCLKKRDTSQGLFLLFFVVLTYGLISREWSPFPCIGILWWRSTRDYFKAATLRISLTRAVPIPLHRATVVEIHARLLQFCHAADFSHASGPSSLAESYCSGDPPATTSIVPRCGFLSREWSLIWRCLFCLGSQDQRQRSSRTLNNKS